MALPMHQQPYPPAFREPVARFFGVATAPEAEPLE